MANSHFKVNNLSKTMTKTRHEKDGDSRILPALIMDAVHVAILLVVGILDLGVQDLGFVQEFVMKAEHLFVLRVSDLSRRSHVDGCNCVLILVCSFVAQSEKCGKVQVEGR